MKKRFKFMTGIGIVGMTILFSGCAAIQNRTVMVRIRSLKPTPLTGLFTEEGVVLASYTMFDSPPSVNLNQEMTLPRNRL